MKFKHILITIGFTFGGLAVSGCNKGPNLTDGEVLALLKADRYFGTLSQEHPTIAKRIVQCVGLISGIDDEVYKDMPGDSLGMMKSGCRQELKAIIDDPLQNPKGVTLEAFENKEFARQIIKVKSQSDAEAKAAQEEKRKSEEAAAVALKEKQLSDFKALWHKSSSSLEKRLIENQALCEQYQASINVLREQKKWNALFKYNKPKACESDYGDRVRQILKDSWTQIGKADTTKTYMFLPDLYLAHPEALEEATNFVKSEIEKLKLDEASG